MKKISTESLSRVIGGQAPTITCTKVYGYNTNPLGTGGMQVDVWYCEGCGGGSCSGYFDVDIYYQQ